MIESATSQKRRSSPDRGYGFQHKRIRDRLAPLVRAGLATCVYCGGRIVGEWDLGHSDDRSHWIGATHPVCNRREAGLKKARLARGQKTVTSQEW